MSGLSKQKRERNAENLGQRLKHYRVKGGFTQKALADAIGLEYYTMVSQMEHGYISIPPAIWDKIAVALGINRDEWVLDCLNELYPEIYSALFGMKSRSEVVKSLIELRKGRYEHGRQTQ